MDGMVSYLAQTLVVSKEQFKEHSHIDPNHKTLQNRIPYDTPRPMNHRCVDLLGTGINLKLRETGDEPSNNYTEGKEAAAKDIFSRFFFPLMVSMLAGLYCLLHVPSVSGVLRSTSTSDNPLRAFIRYFDTILHIIQWFNGKN